MTFSKKFFAAALCSLFAVQTLAPGYAQEQPTTDPQAIINQLLQQLQTAQANQAAAPVADNASAAAATPEATTPVQPEAPPVAQQINPEPVVTTAPATTPAATVATPTSTVAAPAGMTLTMDNLGTFLANIGYEATKASDSLYEIKMYRDNFTIYANVYPESNGKVVWLFAYLREIKDTSNIPSDRLMKLLEANMDIGPTHFYVSKNCIYIGRAFANGTVTPVQFRQEFDELFADCRDTEELWTVDNWTPSAEQVSVNTPAAAPTP